MDRTQLINNLYTNDLELNPSNNEILIANLIIRESSTTQGHVNWIEPQLIKHKAILTEYITLFNSSERELINSKHLELKQLTLETNIESNIAMDVNMYDIAAKLY